jgi:hypothetical protein
MGLLDKIKSDVAKSGSNKGKFIYFREGQKVRVRFLNDMDEGMEVKFHDSFERGINVPCQELFGRNCAYCEDDDLRTRSQYVWSVYDYESKEVKLFMFAVNNCSPIPALMAMYETYGTLTDRDFVITVTGKQQNKTFSVVPMDKNKFRNEKAKPFSEKAILKMLDKAFPADDSDDDEDDDEDEDEDERPAKKSKSTKGGNTRAKAKAEPEEDDADWEDDDEAEQDYSEMTPKELFKLCKDRDIEVVPKKPAKYYINLLEEYDAAQEDWSEDDEDDEEEWEDDE